MDLEEVDSTNLYAERLLQQGPVEEGVVILAAYQTEGKGQGANRWESEPGRNLTFTVVLHPLFLPPARQFLINKVIALGVVDFLSNFVEGVMVKWPNDILIGSKKIGGILIQHMIKGERLETTFAGIGLNINQTSFDHRLSNAASLIQILHQELVIKEALNLICNALEIRYSQLRNNQLAQLESDFCYILLGMQEERTFSVAGQTIPGTILGVDEFGRLIIQLFNKQVKAFNHREIEYLF